MKKTLSEDEERRLERAYTEENLPLSSLEERFGVGSTVIKKTLLRRGVTLRPKGKQMRILT
jgi:hypothetical protein